MLSTLISATVGVVSLYAGGIVQPSRMLATWRTWWVGDMVGVLLIAPIILVWSTPARARREVHRLETVALVAVLFVVSALTFFSELPHVPTLPTPFHQVDLLVAVLLWAAIRFGQRGATTAVLCVSVAAIVATSLRYGPFVRAGAERTAHAPADVHGARRRHLSVVRRDDRRTQDREPGAPS